MRHMTRMLTVACMALMGSFAVAGDMKDDDGMMTDDTMMEDSMSEMDMSDDKMSDHGMAKDDMAGDMGHGMKDDAMGSDGMDDMKKPMDDSGMMKSDDDKM